jgi:CubicO group peptidase (beta-lactamase class C family)
MLTMLLTLLVSATVPHAREVLKQHLQTVTDALSLEHNVSFSVAIRSVATGNKSVIAFSGKNDRSVDAASDVSSFTRFPMGSVTKSWTAAAIMKMQEKGKINIDAPIYQYVDPILQRLNGTTMLKLWAGNPLVNNITARDLMAMRGGLKDYDDNSYAAWTWSHPTADWSPFDILHTLDKTFACPPGSCGVYSSAGYDILGLALVQASGLTHWEDYDQKSSVLPASLYNSSDLASYGGVTFPGKG